MSICSARWSRTPDRDEIVQQLQAGNQPNPEQQQMQQAVQQMEMQKLQAEIQKLLAEAEEEKSKAIKWQAEAANLQPNQIDIQDKVLDLQKKAMDIEKTGSEIRGNEADTAKAGFDRDHLLSLTRINMANARKIGKETEFNGNF